MYLNSTRKMGNRNLEKLSSTDSKLRQLVLGKVSEDDKLIEYDALLLDRFLDILQDLHGQDLKETPEIARTNSSGRGQVRGRGRGRGRRALERGGSNVHIEKLEDPPNMKQERNDERMDHVAEPAYFKNNSAGRSSECPTRNFDLNIVHTWVCTDPSVADPPPLVFGGSITRRGETLSPRISVTGLTTGGLDVSRSL